VAKCAVLKKKKKVYSWCYRNRKWYLVMPILYMEPIFEFSEDFGWKGPVPMIFSDSSKLGFSQNLGESYNICVKFW
jgi:hypothetical protein